LNRGSALLALHAAVALFGFAALFGKWIVLPATSIVLGRTVIAAATLAAVTLVRGEPIGRPRAATVANGAILALHWVSFFAAVQAASVAVALFGYATFPLFVLVLDRKRRSAGGIARDAALAVLATAGLVALVPEFSWRSGGVHGLVLGIVSAVTFAWLSLRTSRLAALMPATRVALWQNAFAALCLMPIVSLQEGGAKLPTASDVALLVLLGVFCTGIAHTLFIASMRRLSVHTASVVAALEPVYGIALAAWLLHEIPGVRILIGGLLVIVAALVATRRSA
jgi:drug/metabolite transporter (DMT)-like permease